MHHSVHYRQVFVSVKTSPVCPSSHILNKLPVTLLNCVSWTHFRGTGRDPDNESSIKSQLPSMCATSCGRPAYFVCKAGLYYLGRGRFFAPHRWACWNKWDNVTVVHLCVYVWQSQCSQWPPLLTVAQVILQPFILIKLKWFDVPVEIKWIGHMCNFSCDGQKSVIVQLLEEIIIRKDSKELYVRAAWWCLVARATKTNPGYYFSFVLFTAYNTQQIDMPNNLHLGTWSYTTRHIRARNGMNQLRQTGKSQQSRSMYSNPSTMSWRWYIVAQTHCQPTFNPWL